MCISCITMLMLLCNIIICAVIYLLFQGWRRQHARQRRQRRRHGRRRGRRARQRSVFDDSGWSWTRSACQVRTKQGRNIFLWVMSHISHISHNSFSFIFHKFSEAFQVLKFCVFQVLKRGHGRRPPWLLVVRAFAWCVWFIGWSKINDETVAEYV